MTNRIVVTVHNNKEYITIATNKRLLGKAERVGNGLFSTADDRALLNKRELAFEKRLLKLPGFEEISVRPFEVSCKLRDAYHWGEVLPPIIPILTKHLRFDEFKLYLKDDRRGYNTGQWGDGEYVHPETDIPDLGIVFDGQWVEPTRSVDSVFKQFGMLANRSELA